LARYTVKSRVLEFLAEYSERGYAVLKAAVEASLSAANRGVRLGDFSFREIVSRLKAWGIEYNPSMLLRIMERDYGIIETSYKSASQHWWKFIDLDAVMEALEEYEKGVSISESPSMEYENEQVNVEEALLKLQIASLNPYELARRLEKFLLKPRLTSADYGILRSIAFNELPAVIDVLQRAEEMGYEGEEIEVLQYVIRLAEKLASKLLRTGKAGSEAAKSLIALARRRSASSSTEFNSSSEIP
jgi:hypothetical protein